MAFELVAAILVHTNHGRTGGLQLPIDNVHVIEQLTLFHEKLVRSTVPTSSVEVLTKRVAIEHQLAHLKDDLLENPDTLLVAMGSAVSAIKRSGIALYIGHIGVVGYRVTMGGCFELPFLYLPESSRVLFSCLSTTIGSLIPALLKILSRGGHGIRDLVSVGTAG